MEHKKNCDILNEASSSTSVTRKQNIVNDQSNANCDVRTENTCNTEVLHSNLCNYNESYNLVGVDIAITGHPIT